MFGMGTCAERTTDNRPWRKTFKCQISLLSASDKTLRHMHSGAHATTLSLFSFFGVFLSPQTGNQFASLTLVSLTTTCCPFYKNPHRLFAINAEVMRRHLKSCVGLLK